MYRLPSMIRSLYLSVTRIRSSFAAPLVLLVAVTVLPGCADLPEYGTPEEYLRDMNRKLDAATEMASSLPTDPGARARELRRLRKLVERIRDYKYASMGRFPDMYGRPFRQWYWSFEMLDWIVDRATAATNGVGDDDESRQRAREQLRILIEIAKDWKESLEQDLTAAAPTPHDIEVDAALSALRLMNDLLQAALDILDVEPLDEGSFREARRLLGAAARSKKFAVSGMPAVRGRRFKDWYDVYGTLDLTLDGALQAIRAAQREDQDVNAGDQLIRRLLDNAKQAKELLERWLADDSEEEGG